MLGDASGTSPAFTRRRVILASVAVLAVMVVLILAVRPWTDGGRDLGSPADDAAVTASSTAVGYSPGSVIDQGSMMPSKGWRSADQTIGAWLSLAWSEPRTVRSVTIVRPSVKQPGITAGSLAFGDGSVVRVVLDQASRTTVVPVTPRSVRSIRFIVSGVSNGAVDVVVDRMMLNAADVPAVRDPQGDATATATITSSTGSATSGLLSGGWSTPTPTETTIRFGWTQPRELVSITLTGEAPSSASIARAVLRFEGGGSVAIGAVPADRPSGTTVAFLPVSTRAATLDVLDVSGTGSLDLASIRIAEQGVDAAPVASGEGTSVEAPAAVTCPLTAPGAGEGLRVLCPTNGARVGDRTTLRVGLPLGATGVTAEVWPSRGARTVPAVQVTGTGAMSVPLELRSLPQGPLTVQLTASGVVGDVVRFQLLRGNENRDKVASSSASRGRTLVYDEEFDSPVSVSRSDDDARYSSGKLERSGVTDFGDAIFADPADGFGNIGALDDRYLRIAVSPKPGGYPDPLGWGRMKIGGILASAHPRGAGFSAQYGYFEARMLAPAVPGTWPAFWLLPSTNLVSQQPAVAEFDALELYGHDPETACHTTHEYVGGDSGGIASCGQRFSTPRSASQWHTYGVDVTPSKVVFYVDGRRVASAPQVRGGSDPMFFLVDLALGGGWPVDLQGTGGRAQLLVDSIRVYV